MVEHSAEFKESIAFVKTQVVSAMAEVQTKLDAPNTDAEYITAYQKQINQLQGLLDYCNGVLGES